MFLCRKDNKNRRKASNSKAIFIISSYFLKIEVFECEKCNL